MRPKMSRRTPTPRCSTRESTSAASIGLRTPPHWDSDTPCARWRRYGSITAPGGAMRPAPRSECWSVSTVRRSASRRGRRSARTGEKRRDERPRPRRDPLPLLRGAARADGGRPRDVAALRELPAAPTSSRRWSRSTRSTSGSVSAAGSCSCRRSSRRRRSSTEYAYFSAYSDSWVEHARRYVEMITRRASGSTRTSLVVELASNDGYLLQHFLPQGAFPCSASTRRRTSRRRRRSAACRRSSSSSASSSRERLVDEGGHADLVARRTTCSRRCRT